MMPPEAARLTAKMARKEGKSEAMVIKLCGKAAGSCVIAQGGSIEEARIIADQVEREMAPGLEVEEREAMQEEEKLMEYFQKGKEALKNGHGHEAVMWFDACLVNVNKYQNEPRVNKYLRKAYRGMILHEDILESMKEDRHRSGIVIIPGCQGIHNQGTCLESFEELSLHKQLRAHAQRHKDEIRLFAVYMKDVVTAVLELIYDKTFPGSCSE